MRNKLRYVRTGRQIRAQIMVILLCLALLRAALGEQCAGRVVQAILAILASADMNS